MSRTIRHETCFRAWLPGHAMSALYRWRWKARHRPEAGDQVVDCRGQLSRIAAINGDDITTADGFRCSWIHCCDWPDE